MSPEGITTLKSLATQKTLYCFDFDGTLAPLKNEPNSVKLNKVTKQYLMEIQKYASIAIISGRLKNDLKKLLNFKVNFLIGNHGLEGIHNNLSILEKNHKRIAQKWFYEISKNSNPLDFFIENKTYSITLHINKQNKNKGEKFSEKINKLIENLSPPPGIILGKRSINLLPSTFINKGFALKEIMLKNRFTHAFYIGDDITDEEVFKLKDNNILTICIKPNGNSRAKYYLNRQSNMNKLLKLIIYTLQLCHKQI